MPVDEEPDKVVESQDDQHVPRHTISSAQGSTKSQTHRLGILQLGWYAHEKKAPQKIQQLMTADDAIRVPGIIPLLARASERDPSVASTYLCHPCVEYITKQKGEGSFCGYRNTQMLVSYILGSNNIYANTFPEGIPSILRLQELIEDAWDRGINSEGRLETGGIIGTRKHIGTPDVQALFQGLGIPCQVGRYVTTSSSSVLSLKSRSKGTSALDLLLDYVEDYFKTRRIEGHTNKIYVTNAPPIYLQRPHHSLTIIGIESRSDGKRNLLVLDPAVRPSEKDIRVAETLSRGKTVHESTKIAAYRKGKWDLGLFKEFETLSLDVTG